MSGTPGVRARSACPVSAEASSQQQAQPSPWARPLSPLRVCFGRRRALGSVPAVLRGLVPGPRPAADALRIPLPPRRPGQERVRLELVFASQGQARVGLAFRKVSAAGENTGAWGQPDAWESDHGGHKGRVCAGVCANTMQSVPTGTCWGCTAPPCWLLAASPARIGTYDPVAAQTTLLLARMLSLEVRLGSSASPAHSLSPVSHPVGRRTSSGEGAVGQRPEFTSWHHFQPSPAPSLVPKPSLP